MAQPGRGHIACTPSLQRRILWLVSRGWTVGQAAQVYDMSGNAVFRQAQRDEAFRRRLDSALAHRRRRRPGGGARLMQQETTEHIILPIAGLNTPADQQTMRETTHAGMLELTAGARHRGPVEWFCWYGEHDCKTALHAAYADDDRPIKTFGLDQFDAFFEHNPVDCVLIIASCEVER